ncbi:MAG: ATP-binding protein [Ardenticatenaceae bacterium]
MNIKTKLTLAFLMISWLSLIITILLSYVIARNALTQQVFNHLESVAVIQEHRVGAILAQNLERLSLVASRTQLRLSLASFISDEATEHQGRMNKILLDALSSIPDFRAIHVLTLDGTIAASTNSGMIGGNHADQEFFVLGQQGSSADLFFLDDKRLMAYLSGPLHLNDQLLGVIVIETNVENIIALVSDYSGLGETGETFLAKRDENRDALFLVPLRFDAKAALSRTVAQKEVNVPMTQALLKNEQLFMDTVDYRGQPVLAATRYLPETDWGLVVKIDQAEALAPVTNMRNLLAFVVLVSSIGVVALSLVFARSITHPLMNLTLVASLISDGDLSKRANVTTQDEIGSLAQAFNKMTATLTEDIAKRKQAEKRLGEQAEELARSNCNLKQLTADLEGRNAELDAFAHTVAHDLKIPLSNIIMFVQLLSDEDAINAKEQPSNFAIILQQALCMNQIVDALLKLAEVRQKEVEMEPLEMIVIISDVQKRVEPLIWESKTQLVLPKSWPKALGYGPWIKEVWANYLSNALKYGGQPPHIELGADIMPDQTVRFWVKDNGAGISPVDQARLFTPFTQLGPTNKGHGLGLSIVQQIIKKCGGQVGCTSNGSGSTFWFTLPAASYARGR